MGMTKHLFVEQGWENYFNMLNGPIYPDLVFDFWRKCDVFTRANANEELQKIIDQNPIVNKDKTRVELGLTDFKETEIT